MEGCLLHTNTTISIYLLQIQPVITSYLSDEGETFFTVTLLSRKSGLSAQVILSEKNKIQLKVFLFILQLSEVFLGKIFHLKPSNYTEDDKQRQTILLSVNYSFKCLQLVLLLQSRPDFFLVFICDVYTSPTINCQNLIY